MSEPFIAEVRIFPYTFAPKGWAFCNGQIMAIAQNQALFSLLGTTYGGDGKTTFALPDLRGRVPVHPGNGVAYGQAAGEEAHTLTVNEMPMHTHYVSADSNDATVKTAQNNTWAKQVANAFGTTPNVVMNPTAIGAAGGSQPHENMQPYLVLNYCIALQGVWPSRN